MILQSIKEEEQKVLSVIIIGAFLIRLLFILEILNTPFVNNLYSDSKLYSDLAHSLLSNSFWLGSEPFSLSPLYPVFLSVFRLLTKENNFTVYIVQAILSSASIYLIYRASINLFGKNVALISALIACSFDSFIFYSGLISYEVLEILLTSLFIFLISDKSNRFSVRKLLVIGLVLGALSLIRESYLLFIIVFIIYTYLGKSISFSVNYAKSKFITTVLAGVLIIIIPFTLINFLLSGDFVIHSTNSGINFYLANNEESNGIFVSPSNFNYESDLAGKGLASDYSNKSLNSYDASIYWYKEAFHEIFSKPAKFIELGIVKLFLFFGSDYFPQASIFDMDFYKENFSNLLKLPFIGYGAISLLSLIGFIFYCREKNKNMIVLLFFSTFLMIIFFSFVNLRYRLGITPVLIIFGSFGASQLFNLFRSNRLKEFYFPAIVLLVFVIMNSFVIQKPKLTKHDAYLQFGKIAEDEGRYEEAIYNYNRSILLKDQYVTFLNLGNTFAKKKDFSNALMAYKEAEKRNPDDYFLHFNKGIILTQVGNYDEALVAYNRSLKLNPKFFIVYRNIGIIFYVNENYSEAQRYFNRFLSLSDDEETKELVRKDLENIQLKLRKN